jgi:hypothetical protein
MSKCSQIHKYFKFGMRSRACLTCMLSWIGIVGMRLVLFAVVDSTFIQGDVSRRHQPSANVSDHPFPSLENTTPLAMPFFVYRLPSSYYTAGHFYFPCTFLRSFNFFIFQTLAILWVASHVNAISKFDNMTSLLRKIPVY